VGVETLSPQTTHSSTSYSKVLTNPILKIAPQSHISRNGSANKSSVEDSTNLSVDANKVEI
jgi:hypothetical protein